MRDNHVESNLIKFYLRLAKLQIFSYFLKL